MCHVFLTTPAKKKREKKLKESKPNTRARTVLIYSIPLVSYCSSDNIFYIKKISSFKQQIIAVLIQSNEPVRAQQMVVDSPLHHTKHFPSPFLSQRCHIKRVFPSVSFCCGLDLCSTAPSIPFFSLNTITQHLFHGAFVYTIFLVYYISPLNSFS